MNSVDFDKCRQFLEDQLSKNIENTQLIGVYQKLLELKSQYDTATDKAVIEKQLRQAEFDAQYNTAVHNANVDYDKAVHRNNTEFGMAANNNAAQFQQHRMTTEASVVNTAMGQSQFWEGFQHQYPGIRNKGF